MRSQLAAAASSARTKADTGAPSGVRDAFSCLAGGVSVVTTWVNGDYGLTATSATSVSMSPPLLLVCIQETAHLYGAILDARRWAVSVLGAQVRKVSEWFSSEARHAAGGFGEVDFRRGDFSNAALLTGSLTNIECVTRSIYHEGDHAIVVG
jgi:flavin reductase (DIM6/NTAB) family NADH-FMN oxidoreductase RutF